MVFYYYFKARTETRKISYERRVYESVDDRSLLWIMSQNRRKVEFKKQKLYLLTNTGKPASLCPLITKNLTIKERTAKLLIPKQKKTKSLCHNTILG